MVNTGNQHRRQFLKLSAAGLATTAITSMALSSMLSGCSQSNVAQSAKVPAYLKDYAELYHQSPKQAAYAWFKAAELGMFIHYGLYSLLGGEYQGKQMRAGNRNVAEWAQLRGKIPVGEYAKLKEQFSAEKFDADFITDLALETGMGYINLTTRHHDSFCLFDSKYTDFNSVNSPAKRDLVGELAEQCQQKGLGLFLYYSHGRDWKHPHAPTKQWHPTSGRPDYDYRETTYAELNDEVQHDIGLYTEFMANQVTELLTNYGPVAGIWLDGEGVLKTYAKKSKRPLAEIVDEMRLSELYAMIRKIQPNCLVSYKKGIEGSEDILAPERKLGKLKNSGKLLEICTTLQEHRWGYNKFSNRKSIDEMMEIVNYSKQHNANLLINTGPMGDGSFVAKEVEIYREIARRSRAAKA